jgi:DNA-binding NarL/FixJ family response regulator
MELSRLIKERSMAAPSNFGAQQTQLNHFSAKPSPSSRKPRIVVIEKNALIRECVARCLAQALGYDVVFCSSIEDWLQIRDDEQPSLLIVCTWHGEGLYALPYLSETARGQRTIVMSNIEDIGLIRQALEHGVRGYIPVSLPLEVAIEAIRLVEAGGVYVPASSLMAPTVGLHGHFTARQAAVVDALCKGKANKRIAHELNMCESTVKVHVRNIMKKLRAKNRTEVALIVNGLLEERSSRHGAT